MRLPIPARLRRRHPPAAALAAAMPQAAAYSEVLPHVAQAPESGALAVPAQPAAPPAASGPRVVLEFADGATAWLPRDAAAAAPFLRLADELVARPDG